MDPTKRPLSLLSSQKRSWSPHGASWSSDNLVFVLWIANGIQNILISALMKSQLVLVLFYYMLTGCERPFLIFQQSRLLYIFFVALFIYSVSKKSFLTTVPAGSGIWCCATYKQLSWSVTVPWILAGDARQVPGSGQRTWWAMAQPATQTPVLLALPVPWWNLEWPEGACPNSGLPEENLELDNPLFYSKQ